MAAFYTSDKGPYKFACEYTSAHTHTKPQPHIQEVKSDVNVVLMPRSTTRKHYKFHKPSTVCMSFIAAEQWTLPGPVCVFMLTVYSNWISLQNSVSWVQMKYQVPNCASVWIHKICSNTEKAAVLVSSPVCCDTVAIFTSKKDLIPCHDKCHRCYRFY